jgi:hypothetical protein
MKTYRLEPGAQPQGDVLLKQIDEILFSIEDFAQEEMRTQIPAEIRLTQAAILEGARLKARIRKVVAPDEALAGIVTAWRIRTAKVIFEQQARERKTCWINFIGFVILTVLYAYWLFNYHKPAVPLASLVKATEEIGPFVQSVFPRVLLCAMLGTILQLASGLLGKFLRDTASRQILSMVCGPVVALLMSFYFAALALQKAAVVDTGVLGGVKTFFASLTKNPSVEMQTQSGIAVDKIGTTIKEVESVFGTLLGGTESNLYFIALLAAFALPRVLQGLMSLSLNPFRHFEIRKRPTP